MKIYFTSLTLLFTVFVNAQSLLDHFEITFPDQLNTWAHTKENVTAKEFFKNNNSTPANIKEFLQGKEDMVKIMDVFKYHPESNHDYIATLSIYLLKNKTDKKTYQKIVSDFLEEHKTPYKDIKRLNKEVKRNGKSLRYYHFFDSGDTKTIKNKMVEYRMNVAQVLIDRKDYFIYIIAEEPLEANYETENIYDSQARQDFLSMIANIRIK